MLLDKHDWLALVVAGYLLARRDARPSGPTMPSELLSDLQDGIRGALALWVAWAPRNLPDVVE